MAGFRETTGSVLTVGGTAFAAKLKRFTPGARSRTEQDTTHMGSVSYMGAKVGKLRKLEAWQFVLDWDPAVNYLDDGAVKTWRITYPLESGESTAAYEEFTGYVQNIAKGENAVDGLVEITMTVIPDGLNYTEAAPT